MTKEKRTADYVLTNKNVDEIIKALEKEPCEDTVSRDSIRLKIAEMPKYTNGKSLASIRHLKNFLEKELEEPIEVTQDMCRGFTIALECIGSFIKSLPSETPTQKFVLDEIRAEISKTWYTQPKNRYEEGLKDQALKDMKIIDKYRR